MKLLIIIISSLTLSLLAVSCGESAKERQAREEAEAQRTADSIAQVEAEMAKIEQHRLDSITNAQKRAERMAADSTLRAELLPAFAEEKNYDGSGATLYNIKTAPKAHLSNYAYLSFSVDNGSAREIFLNVGYNGSDWINIERCTLQINEDDPSEISIENVSHNVNDNLSCSEWFRTAIYSGTFDKLMEAKSVKIKLIGENQNKEISLNPKQIADMQKTIKLFRAFGG